MTASTTLDKELRVRMGRSEALDIIRGWREDGMLVRVEGRLRLFAFNLAGRVLSVAEDEVRILAADTRSEFVLRLTEDLHYAYGDNRIVDGIAKQYRDAIVVFFEPIPDEGYDVDNVCLAATGQEKP